MKTLQKTFPGKRELSLCVCSIITCLLLSANFGTAQTITLTNGGSTASIDLSGSDGINSWTVDSDPGVNQLNSQWFYYSVNGGAVQSIDTLGTAVYTVTNGNTLNATYNNGTVSVSIQYTLQGSGSGSGSADILSDTATATSVSSSTLASLKVFEYANFNLLQSGNNSISISPAYGNPPTYPIVGYSGVSQMSGSTALTESIAKPYANFAEAGIATNVLSDVLSTHDLNNNLSESSGNGNVAWAFEWSYTDVTQGTVEDMLEDQTLSIAPVPEPSTIAIVALGVGAFAAARRRRQSS